MHLLAAKPGGFTDEEGIIDLQQSAADIVILSAQDSALGLLADVADTLPKHYPSVRLANFIHLSKPAAYDLYEDSVLQHCKIIIVSLLGGISYWPYGIQQLQALSKQHAIKLILVPGDDQLDQTLIEQSTCSQQHCLNVWRYLREGGQKNTRNLYQYIAEILLGSSSNAADCAPPQRLPPCLIYNSGDTQLTLDEWQQTKQKHRPSALLLFYRSHVQSGNTHAFDQFIAVLETHFNLLPVATLSLKNHDCLATINHLINTTDCDIVINTTSFSQHIEGNAALSSEPQISSPLFEKNIPVIQAILASNSESDWQQSTQGLRPRDITMNVALPEFDGRIISRAISFKALYRRSSATQIDIMRYQLHTERAEFVAKLALHWANLRHKKNHQKRIAIILANYPTKDGRIGNGVGLDTPTSVINILKALQNNDYPINNIPQNGDHLIQQLQSEITNNIDTLAIKACNQSISIKDYNDWFKTLPQYNQDAILQRWGAVESDPKYRQGRLMIAGIRLAETFVGIQPARGFNVDIVANYHDPDLVPPHNYLAFYYWLRHVYKADAFAHIGKHGNLEWLPGKSLALSAQCWPDLIFGPVPHLYPFIVNDPGEGAQAKRRIQAVIIDHLMPPMARAEAYGDLLELEKLIDEYYQTLGVDPKRKAHLSKKILSLITDSNLAEELNLSSAANQTQDELFNEVDTYLCELKEAQIRNGLHRFGQLPDQNKLIETLVALTRLPRGKGSNDAGILHSLSHDLNLENIHGTSFDPLKFNPAQLWQGHKPAALQNISKSHWRTEADTRERLELLAEQCIANTLANQPQTHTLPKTEHLLEYIKQIVIKAVIQSSENEISHFIGALNGHFVPAGPSGAPTRGRLDVLPTGRNFYSLDARSIPTQSAWELGQLSANELLLRHLQEQGEYPKQLGLSVWGTSTMRTGGDDIAQAFALMGVKPVWSEGSNRVTDIEIIPGFQLGRPRVDVTLRISGFFRDAFPNVAKLFDQAVQTLADYEEPGDSNTLRQHIETSFDALISQGIEPKLARTQARFRIFGSKPGSYGAGLQGLIDESAWDNQADLAKAYVNWGGYSYSQKNFGEAAFTAFESRLSQIDVVIQNQDNREHDLLDSDDYYQFQGGMSNAVCVLKGDMPSIYHGDHANPANPKIRTLKEELNRVIRARVTNPKWINAMQQHGYKGAFEMAASVDYLFAYDATTNLIDDYQYQAVTDALVMDDNNRQFLTQSNPHALKEMAEKLLEAQQRGLWKNPGDYQQKLTETILSIDDSIESIEPTPHSPS